MWIILLMACDDTGVKHEESTDTSADPDTTTPPGGEGGEGGEDSEPTTSCPEPTACISLAEAFDRGFASIDLTGSGWGGSSLRIYNSDDYNICMDEWIVVLSSGSQDAIAGITPDSEITDRTSLLMNYGQWSFSTSNETWWCIEHNQLTSIGEVYSFNGALAPEPLLQYALNQNDQDADGLEDHSDTTTGNYQTQESIWAYIQDNPVIIVGRSMNWLQLEPGETGSFALEVTNLGRQIAYTTAYETLPFGVSYVSSDVEPSSVVSNTDGSTTLSFAMKLDAAIDSTDQSDPATYDTQSVTIEVMLEPEGCNGRITGSPPTADWMDRSGADYTSSGMALIIECCSP